MIFDLIVGSGQTTSDPSALFASGEQGAWYDPSDISTMFQDRAGTTPVTADGQTVGKILDKSGRGNHAVAPTDASRPIYKTNGVLRWLQFDGANDILSTANVSWGTDKASAFVGVTFNDNIGLYGTPFCFGNDPNTDIGSFAVYNSSYANGDYCINAKGAAVRCLLSSPGASMPRTLVGTTTYDLAQIAYQNSLKMRINAVAQTLTLRAGTDMGGGNFGTWPISVGGSSGIVQPLLGNIYSIIIVDRLATTQEITDTEHWVASKTGVTLP